MKKIVLAFLLAVLLIFVAWLSQSAIGKRAQSLHLPSSKSNRELSAEEIHRIKGKASLAKAFIRQKPFNDTYCFLIDMSLASGQKRFFVYNLQKDSIEKAALVTHGRCNETWLEGRKYDNIVGCGCSSLGKYKIGYAYQGRFGLAYKLYGLDKSNDKAFERFVVLHAHDCVPDEAVEKEICQSDGCPTVSPDFLQWIKPVINQSKKPILLWIFDDTYAL